MITKEPVQNLLKNLSPQMKGNDTSSDRYFVSSKPKITIEKDHSATNGQRGQPGKYVSQKNTTESNTSIRKSARAKNSTRTDTHNNTTSYMNISNGMTTQQADMSGNYGHLDLSGVRDTRMTSAGLMSTTYTTKNTHVNESRDYGESMQANKVAKKSANAHHSLINERHLVKTPLSSHTKDGVRDLETSGAKSTRKRMMKIETTGGADTHYVSETFASGYYIDRKDISPIMIAENSRSQRRVGESEQKHKNQSDLAMQPNPSPKASNSKLKSAKVKKKGAGPTATSTKRSDPSGNFLD